MSKKRILITGSSGLLGFNLSYLFHQQNRFELCGQYFQSTHAPQFIKAIPLDLTKNNSVSPLIETEKPDIIINCAAMTNVDQCEVDPYRAFAINTDLCTSLAKTLNGSSTKLIHISTDQLWDGRQSFVKEETMPGPLNVYAKSKLRGEYEAKSHRHHLILRTNFFGGDLPWRQSFTGWLKSQFEKKEAFNSFKDVYFTPISIPMLFDILTKAIDADLHGTYHVGGKTRLSKYEFALNYAAFMNFDANLLNQISIDQHHFKATRPKDMSLDSSKIERELEITLPTVEASFSAMKILQDSQSQMKII